MHFAQDYTAALGELTFNSKVHINALTMLAGDFVAHSQLVVDAIMLKIMVRMHMMLFHVASQCHDCIDEIITSHATE